MVPHADVQSRTIRVRKSSSCCNDHDFSASYGPGTLARSVLSPPVKRLAERHAMNIRCTAQVVDVRIDGVSLAMNDRAQFNKISRTSFCATSIQRMGKME